MSPLDHYVRRATVRARRLRIIEVRIRALVALWLKEACR